MSGPNFVNSIVTKLDGIYKVFKDTPPQNTVVDWKVKAISYLRALTVRQDTFTSSAFACEMHEVTSSIVDSSTSCINFEIQESSLSSARARARKQHLGMHVHANGMFVHGVQVEALRDREWDDVSPYLLSYLLSEIHADTCLITSSFLNSFQKEMLTNLYAGMDAKRSKFVCITADRLDPQLNAKDCMGSMAFRADCERLIGDLYDAKDLGPHDLVAIGSNGILLTGPSSKEAEYLILDYAGLKVIDFFVRRLHSRMRGVNNFLSDCRLKMVSRDVSKLEKTLESHRNFNQILLSFQTLRTCLGDVAESISRWENNQKSKMNSHQSLYEFLNLRSLHEEVASRHDDLENVFLRAQNEIETILEVSNMEGRIRYERVLMSVHKDFKSLSLPRGCSVSHSGKILFPSHVALRVVSMALLASLVYDIVNRIHIGIQIGTRAPSWLVNHTNSWNDQPFLLAVALLVVVLLADRFLVKYIEKYSEMTTSFVKKVLYHSYKIANYNQLLKFLDRKNINFARFRMTDNELDLRKVFTASFMDKNFSKWTTDHPRISMQVDSTNLWILSAQYDWDYYSKGIAATDVKKDFTEQLEKADIIETRVKRRGWVLSKYLNFG
eukprot:755846-Hanusia_phi.AAC.5